MPSQKIPCPKCARPMAPKASTCRQCLPPYERTAEHRAKMTEALKGKPHSWRSASTRPEVAEKIRASWTQERREEARLRGLQFAADRAWRDLIARSVTGALNPNHQGKDNATGYGPGWGRHHKALIRERAGNRCEMCGAQGRLDIHHKDHTKTNHHPDNLQALCRKCHKRPDVHGPGSTPCSA